MRAPPGSIVVALLGFPDATAATLYGFLDVLAATRRDWQLLNGGEVVDSPFVFTTDVARTFGLALTMNPDEAMHEFPPEAIGGTYQVSIAFSSNATPAVTTFAMPATTWSDPLQLSFSDLPAGGRSTLVLAFFTPVAFTGVALATHLQLMPIAVLLLYGVTWRALGDAPATQLTRTDPQAAAA